MALSVYLRANAAEKVVNSFSQRGEFDKMVAYASKVGLRERASSGKTSSCDAVISEIRMTMGFQQSNHYKA